MRTWARSDLELLEHAPDAMVVVEENGTIVFANSQTERVFGYEVSALVGQPVEMLIPRAFRHDHQARRAAYQSDPHPRAMGAGLDLVGHRRDGSEIPIDISLSPLTTDQGRMVIAAVRDMSDRRGIERRLRAANERLRRDLDAAARVQRALLPTGQPQVDSLRVSWAFEPCERLAGDSFNVFELDSGRMGLYLLDVSGHGVVAALQAVALTRVLSAAPWPSTMLRLIESPAAVVEALNAEFPIEPESWQYFTFLCAVIDVPRREIRYATGGHPGPVLVTAGKQPTVLDAEGFPIGLFPDADYDEFRVALTPRDRLYFYSDGVTDAMDGSDESFGAPRLVDLVARHQADDLPSSVEAVRSSVIEWAAERRPQDDVSLVGVEFIE